MYVICVGNPFDGMTVYGDKDGRPFEDGDVANEFAAEEYRGSDWWVLKIRSSGFDQGALEGAA